jgi:hypothetical protein
MVTNMDPLNDDVAVDHLDLTVARVDDDVAIDFVDFADAVRIDFVAADCYC